MVVVASLIGAKGLGEDVLEALQYANVGQGILAGFAILFCAMILDRIVQGERKWVYVLAGGSRGNVSDTSSKDKGHEANRATSG